MPKKEYLRKVSSLLFTGKASDFGAWSGVLLDHKNLINHQITIVSSGVLAAGVYDVRIIPDSDEVIEASVDTGEVLDIAGQSSAIATFSAVIKGVHIIASTPLSAGETISVVLSSYTKIAPEPIHLSAVTYISSLILDSRSSSYGEFAREVPRHSGMIFHQVSLASSGVLAAGEYNVKMIPDVDETLEDSVDIGKALVIAGQNSAFVQFNGVLKGVHLVPATGLTAGETISVVLSSSEERFDSIVAEAISASPGSHVHVEADITDLDKYTQAQVDAAISTHATDANTHTNLILDAGFF